MRNEKQLAGFTLIEVVVSMAVTSILVAGMASTIYVTTRANDPSKGPVPGTIEGTRAAQLIAADVQLAQTFTTRSASEVVFSVADRNGDSLPDTIRYKWSGTPGDPLTVQYNNGNTVPLVADVRDCQFTYKTQTVAKSTTSQTTVNSGETLLASWNLSNWPGFSGSATNRTITTVNWSSECFPLNVPTSASNLQVTRVRVWLKKTTGLNSTTLAVYSASGGTGPLPGSQIGSTATKANSALTTSYAPIDFLFTDVPVSSATSSYNIVLKGTGATAGSNLQSYNWTSGPADSSIMKLYDAGIWSPVLTSDNNKNDFPFEVYGTYDSQQTVNTTTNRYFVRGVSLKLRVGGDSTSQVSTSSLVLNSPEVSGP